MALQGEARKLYHREYMRRRRAGLPTRGVVKPMVMEQWCSECVLPPSPERIVISLGSGYCLCGSATRRLGLYSPQSAPCANRCGPQAEQGATQRVNPTRCRACLGVSSALNRRDKVSDFKPAMGLGQATSGR